MDKTTIIVVEDNIVYCEFVCNMLAREGYRTVKAYHLSTAKKHLQQATDNDIVVADLRLPDGSAFQKIMHRIRLVAATDMSVMIFGENGTGKEHIAHHLHDKSKRAVKPFVAVDCRQKIQKICKN